MIFKTLLELARTGDFTMAVKASGAEQNTLTLLLVPTAKNDAEPALSQPLLLKGTVEELDAGFVQAVQQFGAARTSLVDQVAATVTILNQATAAQADKSTTALKGPAAKKMPALKAPSTAAAPKTENALGNNDDDDDDADGETPIAGQDALTSPASSSAAPSGMGNLFG